MTVLTNKGVFADSRNALIDFVATRCDQLLGRPIDRSIGSALFTFIRAAADLTVDESQNFEDFSHYMSVIEAIGEFLEMHGFDSGNQKLGATKAYGTLRITGLAQGSPAGDVPTGTIFATSTSVNYITTEDVTLIQSIPVIHQTDNVDAIPSPYSNITAGKIISVSKYADGTGQYSNGSPGWQVTGTDEISWTGSDPDTPRTNQVYFVNLDSSQEIDVDVSIIAEKPGTKYNVVKNTITVNQSGLSSISTVTNPQNITNAVNEETEESYRNRLLGAPFRDWTVARMKSEALKITGVHTIQVREYEGTDQFDPSDWTSIGDTPTKPLDASVEHGQLFQSGARVLGLSAITLRVKAQDALATAPMNAGVYIWRGDYASTISQPPMASFTFGPEDLDQDRLTEFQNIRIPLKTGNLDQSLRYLLRVWVAPGSSGMWLLVYNSSPTQVLGLYTLLVSVPPATVNYAESLAFKTHFYGNGYTCYASAESGYTFSDIESQINSKLEDFTPISVPFSVLEADTVPINIKADLILEEGYEGTDVTPDIDEGINGYLNSLGAGEKVVIAEIGAIIIENQGVRNYRNLYITRSTSSPIPPEQWMQQDIFIGENEVSVLGTPGTQFTVV